MTTAGAAPRRLVNLSLFLPLSLLLSLFLFSLDLLRDGSDLEDI